MTTKLHINLSQGIIDIEGDPDLVREIYTDFKEKLIRSTAMTPQYQDTMAQGHEAGQESANTDNDTSAKARAKPRPKRRVTSTKKDSDTENGGIQANTPKIDKSLDTSKLPEYYGQFEVKNNAEKILIFLKFMTEELDIEAPNTDQFYTCFEKVRERIPKVFSQAFRDASGRRFGFIDYNSPTDIKLTIKGNNHFNFDMTRKAGTE